MPDHATWATAACTSCGRYVRCCAGCGKCDDHHEKAGAPSNPTPVVTELAGGGVMELAHVRPGASVAGMLDRINMGQLE